MTETSEQTVAYQADLARAIASLEIAMPPGEDLGQDEEWVVVNLGGQWRKIRLHDYGSVYAVPGLYEKWVYDVRKCRTPQHVAKLLIPQVAAAGMSAADLRMLDLGAGNGYVADVMSKMGAGYFVGVDIFPQAKEAAYRDRPGLYQDYIVGDLTALPAEDRERLVGSKLNCLACVAALGFGDIPPAVFAEAYNLIEDQGWVAFTIKPDFMSESDQSGFSKLIRRMIDQGVMTVSTHEPFDHRTSADGTVIVYEAFVGRKAQAISSDWYVE